MQSKIRYGKKYRYYINPFLSLQSGRGSLDQEWKYIVSVQIELK